MQAQYRQFLVLDFLHLYEMKRWRLGYVEPLCCHFQGRAQGSSCSSHPFPLPFDLEVRLNSAALHVPLPTYCIGHTTRFFKPFVHSTFLRHLLRAKPSLGAGAIAVNKPQENLHPQGLYYNGGEKKRQKANNCHNTKH